MANRNPYASPGARVADAHDPADYGDIRLFTAQGRIGRVRYIGYVTGLSLLIGAVGFGLALVTLASEEVVSAIVIAAVTYLTIVVVRFLLTIQRAHDFDVTGWLSLVTLVPFGVLIFWFVPGSQGENRFGKSPPPNTTGAIVLACIMPVLLLLGVVGSAIGGLMGQIAIPF